MAQYQPALPVARSPKIGTVRRFIDAQIMLSEWFDRLFPERYRTEGNHDFRTAFVPRYLRPNLRVYDVGGGKHPHFGVETKRTYHLNVVGIDIDAHELARAPEGGYDETLCADITDFEGRHDADLVICRALLEHVPDVDKALGCIASLLKPGGTALIFVPCRHALFARLNLMLPQRLKQKLLYAIYPDAERYQGFVSYYHRCTPRDFEAIAEAYGLEVKEGRLYYFSHYFQCCFPVFILWRAWILCFHLIAGKQAAETFSIALRKPLT